MVRLTGPLVLCVGLELSVTSTVRFAVPAVAGVPLTVHPFRLNPAGSVPPVMVQLYGCVPPVIPNVALYAVPTVPLGRVGARVSAPPVGTTVSVMVAVPVSGGLLESVAFTAKVYVPAAVGNPLIVQLFAAKLNPAGNDPAMMLQE